MVAYYEGGGWGVGRDAVAPRKNAIDSANEKLGRIVEELGSTAQSSAKAMAERLLSDSLDRLIVVATKVAQLAAETAIDLALIESTHVQIDRALAENWALLRELTGQAQ